MSISQAIRSAACSWVYNIGEAGEGGHYAPAWEESCRDVWEKCPDCNGVTRHWPHPIDVHLLTMKHSAIFTPWYLRIWCVEGMLADAIRPHMEGLAWGQVMVANSERVEESQEFVPSQFRRVSDYQCFYATDNTNVPSYGTGKNAGRPRSCETCRRMLGFVPIDEAFVLNTDWNDRNAGLKNGGDLLVSESLYQRIDWAKLRPVIVTQIPVVQREDVPAELQNVLWGAVTSSKSIVSEKNTPKRLPERSTSNRAIVRLMYNDLDGDLGYPAIRPDVGWKQKQFKRWCCEVCTRQKNTAAGREQIVVNPRKGSQSLTDSSAPPFLRISGTRMLVQHRDIAAAIASIDRNAMLTQVCDAEHVPLPYFAVAGIPRLAFEVEGCKVRACEACGLMSVLEARGLITVARDTDVNARVFLDADGYLGVREDVLDRFQKLVGGQLCDQLVFQYFHRKGGRDIT